MRAGTNGSAWALDAHKGAQRVVAKSAASVAFNDTLQHGRNLPTLVCRCAKPAAVAQLALGVAELRFKACDLV